MEVADDRGLPNLVERQIKTLGCPNRRMSKDLI